MAREDGRKPVRGDADSSASAVQVVHEGRGGYVAIDQHHYPIEHVEGGRFAIYFPAGNRSKRRHEHLAILTELCAKEPDKWYLERRDRR